MRIDNQHLLSATICQIPSACMPSTAATALRPTIPCVGARLSTPRTKVTDLQQSGCLALRTGYRNERASARLLPFRDEGLSCRRVSGATARLQGILGVQGAGGIVGRRLNVWSALETKGTSDLSEAEVKLPLGT